MRHLALFAVALFAVASAVRADPPFDPATADPPADAAFPSRNQQLLVPSGGEEMNALLMLASGPGPKPTVVLLHGLPGNEQNLDLAQAIRRAGWNVLTLHYRGSWGSPGTFSIANAAADADAAVAFLRRPDIAAKYAVDAQRLVIAGHSMGGFAAARHAAGHDDVIGLILLDAWNPGVDARLLRERPATRAEFVAGFDDLGHSLVGADAESMTVEVETSPADWDLVASAPQLARVPVLTIWAERGIAAPNAALAAAIRVRAGARVSVLKLPTDHAFSDHRIAVARAVVHWLQALPPTPTVPAG